MMNDLQIRSLAGPYLRVKMALSCAIGALFWWERAELPVLGSAEEVESLVSELVYTGDGPMGIADFIQRADRVHWHVLRARKAKASGKAYRWPMIDCDDYANYAKQLFLKMGWKARIVNLVDPGIVKSHTICWFESPHGTVGTVDTNGLIYWESLRTAAASFSRALSAQYVLVEDEGSPGA